MKDPSKRQYTIIITLNLIFLFSIISFFIYFNPFGNFTLLPNAETGVRTYHVTIAVILSIFVIIANLLLIAFHKKRKK